MDVLDQLYTWTDYVLWWALAALRAWALADCVTRRTPAFPAVGKLTKPAWVAILFFGGLIGTFFSYPPSPGNVVNIIPLITVVAAAVYLADVRPAVREITG